MLILRVFCGVLFKQVLLFIQDTVDTKYPLIRKRCISLENETAHPAIMHLTEQSSKAKAGVVASEQSEAAGAPAFDKSIGVVDSIPRDQELMQKLLLIERSHLIESIDLEALVSTFNKKFRPIDKMPIFKRLL